MKVVVYEVRLHQDQQPITSTKQGECAIFPKAFSVFLLSYRRKKVSNALSIESQVLDILRSYPNSELLSCKLADDIATTLLGATP